MACSAQMIRAGGQIDLVAADRLAFGRHLDRRLARRAATVSVISIGKRSPLNTCAGKRDGFQQQAGLRTPGQRDRVDRNPELLRLPDGARDAAQVLVAVGDQQQARHHAGGQRRRAVADRRFQIGAVARRAGGVAQLPVALDAFVAAPRRGWRGRTASRASSAARGRVRLGRRRQIRFADPAGETLADVSASIATATLVSYTVSRGAASASAMADERPGLQQQRQPARGVATPTRPTRRAAGQQQRRADDRMSSAHLRSRRLDFAAQQHRSERQTAPRRKRPYRIHSDNQPERRPASPATARCRCEPSSARRTAECPYARLGGRLPLASPKSAAASASTRTRGRPPPRARRRACRRRSSSVRSRMVNGKRAPSSPVTLTPIRGRVLIHRPASPLPRCRR